MLLFVVVVVVVVVAGLFVPSSFVVATWDPGEEVVGCLMHVPGTYVRLQISLLARCLREHLSTCGRWPTS